MAIKLFWDPDCDSAGHWGDLSRLVSQFLFSEATWVPRGQRGVNQLPTEWQKEKREDRREKQSQTKVLKYYWAIVDLVKVSEGQY